MIIVMAKTNGSRKLREARDVFRFRDYPFISMADIIFRINQNLSVALRPSGVSIPMWRVLAMLQEKDGLTLGELSDAIFVERSALSWVIDAMEKTELVRRETHGADRRYTQVMLCPKGYEKFKQILPTARGQIEWALQGFSAKELRNLQDTLDRVVGNFESLPNIPRRGAAIARL